jgi:beta-glucosidase
VHALIATGTPVVVTPVVVVLLSGRPFALGSIVVEQGGEGAAAVVQAFFPRQLGGAALARVLSGAANPSGRLPVTTPRESGSQPGTDLTAPLGRRTEVSNIDPTPLSGFGHGLTSSTFERSAAAVRRESHWRTDGSVRVGLTVTNASSRSGTDVVRLCLHDPVGPGHPSCGPAHGLRAGVACTGESALSSFCSGPRRRRFGASPHCTWRIRSVPWITRAC